VTFDLTLDVKHVGATFGDDDNTTEIDGYTLVDAAASWDITEHRRTLQSIDARRHAGVAPHGQKARV